MKSRFQGRNPLFLAAGLGRRKRHPTQAPAPGFRPGADTADPGLHGSAASEAWAVGCLGVRGPGERGWRDAGAGGLRRGRRPKRAARSICLTHKDPHLLLPEDPRKERGHREAHGGARGGGAGRGRGARAGTGRPRGDGAQQQKEEAPPPPPPPRVRVRPTSRGPAPPGPPQPRP